MSGTIVRRYRDEAETLDLLVEVLDEVGAAHELDREVQLLRAAHGSELAILERVRNAGDITAIEDLPEFRSGRRLLPYQKAAVARHLFATNAADFSVPGSGKTAVTLAYWALAQRDEPALGLWVIGPLSCFRPWEEEFELCFGRLPRAMRIRGSSAHRARLLQDAANYEVLLASYQGAWRDLELFRSALQVRPWLLVLDEAHYIKSSTGVLSDAVRRLL